MNLIKNSLLILALISAPLVAMDQESPKRMSPCTQLKAAFVLGLALFSGKAMLDSQAATPEMFDPSISLPVAAGLGSNAKAITTIDPIFTYPMREQVEELRFGIDERDYHA